MPRTPVPYASLASLGNSGGKKRDRGGVAPGEPLDRESSFQTSRYRLSAADGPPCGGAFADRERSFFYRPPIVPAFPRRFSLVNVSRDAFHFSVPRLGLLRSRRSSNTGERARGRCSRQSSKAEIEIEGKINYGEISIERKRVERVLRIDWFDEKR